MPVPSTIVTVHTVHKLALAHKAVTWPSAIRSSRLLLEVTERNFLRCKAECIFNQAPFGRKELVFFIITFVPFHHPERTHFLR
jgi:hypothetical protein